MYIVIRSSRHDSSTAFTHGADVQDVVNRPSFRDAACTPSGDVKPLTFVYCDGRPGENPRFPKVLQNAIEPFKTFDLDAYITMTHAPGLSAYNFVERRMAPLSKELAGVVLHMIRLEQI